MKFKIILTISSLCISAILFSQQFFLPGDGNWYKVASIGGIHGSFEYIYSHGTGNNPSITKGSIMFINAQNFTVQHHQSMGYNSWNQPQFALLNFGNLSEIWVKATNGVWSGNFKVINSLNVTINNGDVSDSDLTDNGGSLVVYDKLKDNTHSFLGDVNINSGRLGIGTTPLVPFQVSSNYSKTDNSPRDIAFFGSNEYPNPAALTIQQTGAAQQSDRVISLQTHENGIINEGKLALQPHGGKVGIGTTNPSQKLHLNGGILRVSGGPTGAGEINLDDGVTEYSGFQIRKEGAYWALKSVAGGNDLALFTDNVNSRGLYIKNSNGNVGIGTTDPKSKFHVGGDNFITIGDYSGTLGSKGIIFTGFRDNTASFLGASIEAVPAWVCCGNYPSAGYAGVKMTDINFNVHDPQNWNDANAKITALHIDYSGKIGIGTTSIPGDYKLAVQGTIGATKVKVTQQGWADYVFAPSYKLLSLPELENYINKHKHLPDVPSADEVAKDGLDVGGNQAVLLKKIEELTLYMIEQNKELKAQKEEIKALKQLVKFNNNK